MREHPKTVALVAMLVAIASAIIATRLELRTRYDQLLPDGAPSAVELARLSEKTTGGQTILVVLESRSGGDETKELRAFGDALVQKLPSLGPSEVASAEDGVQNGRAFLMARAGLFLDTKDLEKLRADVDERWDRQVARETGTSLDDDEAPDPHANDSLRDRLRAAGAKSERADRYPDGYYQTKDGKALVVVVRSPAHAGDLARSRDVVAHVRAIVDELARDHAAIKAGYAGDMIAGIDEYGAVRSDLLGVGVTGVALVLAVILLYFARLRSLFVLGASIAVGLSVTFALTTLVIGHLNVATGFLFSIVAGNGINAGIIYLGRYDEERRRGLDVAQAIRITHRATLPATAMAAFAAAASYSSLAFTKFPAFHEFAFIGASGMIICWIVTITVVPALLAIFDHGGPARRGVPFGEAFAFAVTRAPHALASIGAFVAVAGAVTTTSYVASRPLEYDLKHIQMDHEGSGERDRVWDIATSIVGQLPQAAIVVTNAPSEAKELATALQNNHDVGPVHTIYDFIPDDQPAKIATLEAIAARVKRGRELHMIDDADWNALSPLLPPEDLAPFGPGELPASLAAPFTEKNGTRGTMVIIEPAPGPNSEDLHYLLRYANAFREVHLPSGAVVRGSGRAVVFADILAATASDIPIAIAASLAMTIACVAIALRRSVAALWVLGALFVGVAGVGLFLSLDHVRINFLNFAALPITFGIGVDYAVNVMQRHREDQGGDVARTLRTSGGAVVLCSLTTTLGYFALLRSHNQAIRSFGAIAVVGEISCLLAAVLVLPAALRLTQRASGDDKVRAA